jgi:hypothetical protein
MRTAAFAAVVVSLLLFPVGRGRAQSANLQSGIFFAPNSARRVTLTTNGEPLATFNIPKGKPGKTLEQVMREAPLILSGQGMDVVVENVP